MGRILTFQGRGIGSNCYLYTDDSETASVLIDPSASPGITAPIFGQAARNVSFILLTHAHADHLISLAEWKEATGAPVLIGRYDRYALRDPEANVAPLLGLPTGDFGDADGTLEDGEEIFVGNEKLTVLHTPGHTVGSVSFLSSDALFTGDTLFSFGGVGRTDFFGGSDEALFESVHRLLALPAGLPVYPGHGPQTTIGRERHYHNYHPI